MIWFLQSRQAQTLKDSSVTNSTLQLTQAGRDALSFQNVEQVAISYNGLFGSRQIVTGIDWKWAGGVLHEQQAEVRNRLKYVLRDCAPMNVQLSEQPDRVNLPALESERRLMIAGQDSELIDPGQLMIEVFGREDIVGKLLILGTPGAGKTTVLLSLAEQLLVGAIASPQTCIPIIFELSTWKNDNQPIQDWLIEQLYDLYGGDRKLRRYEQWLEKQVLLPLLDGLDELGMERQQKCMAKLNEFTRQYRQVVVCCRSKEFEESGIRLGNLRGAVALEPLSDRQIQTYLQQVEREGLWQQIQKTPEMQQMLEPNNGEAGLLRVPLFVSLAAAIYDQNQPFRTKGELLERYVDRQLRFDMRMSDRRKELERRRWAYATVEKEPTVKVSQQHLGWLAQRLNKSNQVNFVIEKMQPSWLEQSQHQKMYQLLVALGVGFGYAGTVSLSFGLIGGLWVGLIYGLNKGLIIGLIGLIFGLLVSAVVSGLTYGLVIGLIFGFTFTLFSKLNDIEPVESFRISILNVRRQIIMGIFKAEFIFWFIFWFIAGIIYGLFSGVPGALLNGLLFGLVVGLIFGSTLGLVFGLVGGLIRWLKQELKIRSQPNQGIWNSFRNLCFSNVVISLGVSCIVWVITLLEVKKGKLPEDLFTTSGEVLLTIVICLSMLVLLFQSIGGSAFVQHFCLRFVLARSGAFPFFCVPFLNYCTERRLLQRIGGRYRFIHRELLEHFATQGD